MIEKKVLWPYIIAKEVSSYVLLYVAQFQPKTLQKNKLFHRFFYQEISILSENTYF